MPFRFRKSIKLAPGVRLNVGKRASSLTIGRRGASINFGSRGAHANVGIPGTGLSYRSKIGGGASTPIGPAGRSSESSTSVVEIKAALALQEDGTTVFKDANGNFLPEELVREAKRQNKDLILGWLHEQCDNFNREIESLLNLHLFTPPPDTEIMFKPARFDLSLPVVPSDKFPITRPEPPRIKEQSFLAKKIGLLGKRLDAQNEHLQRTYEEKLHQWEGARAKFQLDFEIKHREYVAQLTEYQKQKAEFEKEQEQRRRLVEEDRLIDVNAMQTFLAEALQSIVWPRETTVSFEVRDEGKTVSLDMDLPEIEDMPVQQASVNKRDLKLKIDDRSKTQRQKDYLTHIHAIGFRLIGEIFISLPTVQTVVLSAYSQRSSKVTGQINDEYLYSAKVSRLEWAQINFQNLSAIDVVKSFEEFELRRHVTKTGSMSPIEPFSN